MAPRSKVHSLPPELKEWLDAELVKRAATTMYSSPLI